MGWSGRAPAPPAIEACKGRSCTLFVLRCSEVLQQTVGMGHVWTVPAVQEEFDYQRSVRVRSCIRPVVAWRITSVAMQPLWPLALM